MKKRLRIGSRGSKLALAQSELIADRLRLLYPDLYIDIEIITTLGDVVIDKPLPDIGGKGLFTEEIERALRNNRIDIAVHSLKDLPVEEQNDLCISAIPVRGDAQDILLAASPLNADGEHGALVGTSSPRRKFQLLRRFPDLTVKDIRGNISTRIDKLLGGQYRAIVLAVAGLNRAHMVTPWMRILTPREMLPAPGQGALAIQCRCDDEETRQLLEPLHDDSTAICVDAERHLLTLLGGGCSAPVGALARIVSGQLVLAGIAFSREGKLLGEAQVEVAPNAPRKAAAELAKLLHPPTRDF